MSSKACQDGKRKQEENGGMIKAKKSSARKPSTPPPGPLQQQFGNMIREARERKGLSQSALAKALDVSRQAVNTWEIGSNFPSVKRWSELIRVLGLPSDAAGVPQLELRSNKTDASAPAFDTIPTAQSDEFRLDTKNVRFIKMPTGALFERGIVYCLVLSNDTMVPWRYPMDAVFFSERPPRAGDYVLVQFGGTPWWDKDK